MHHLSCNNIPDLMLDPSWSDDRGPLRLLCRVYIVHTVLYSTPLLDDHKRRSLSEVLAAATISRILLIAASAKQTKPKLRVVTGSLYCTDYLPIIFNVPSSYLAP